MTLGVVLLILLLVCVIMLAYKHNYTVYTITDASGSKLTATMYNGRDRDEEHHAWKDTRTHGDQWESTLW